MKASHLSDEYEKGVEDFFQFAQQNAPIMSEKYLCVCLKCVNERRQSLNDIKSYFICEGMYLIYTK